ncbi:MAG TPA: HEAT repeat domain-containing protein [Gaiellaceae bacterium]|nr:HEAT repeat domain-containing protein [Gaiellaceae bacterium]
MSDRTAARLETRARRDAYVAARKEAATTLETGSLDEMVQLLDSPWKGVRLMVVRALRRGIRREALPQLVEHAVTKEDEFVRRSIALALADLSDEISRETLWRLLEDQSQDVRRSALRGLSRLGDERVVPIAVDWYQTGGVLLRAEAVGALLTLQTKTGTGALEGLLSAEPSWRRRRLIRRAMRKTERHKQ